MNTIKNLVIDVVGDEPISKGNVAIAIDVFRANYIDRPEQLICGIDAYRDLMEQNLPELTRSIDLHTFMGLHVRIDPDLDENEFRVRKENSKTYALETAHTAEIKRLKEDNRE